MLGSHSIAEFPLADIGGIHSPPGVPGTLETGKRYLSKQIGTRNGLPVYASSCDMNLVRRHVSAKIGQTTKPVFALGNCEDAITTRRYVAKRIGTRDGKPVYARHCCESTVPGCGTQSRFTFSVSDSPVEIVFFHPHTGGIFHAEGAVVPDLGAVNGSWELIPQTLPFEGTSQGPGSTPPSFFTTCECMWKSEQKGWVNNASHYQLGGCGGAYIGAAEAHWGGDWEAADLVGGAYEYQGWTQWFLCNSLRYNNSFLTPTLYSRSGPYRNMVIGGPMYALAASAADGNGRHVVLPTSDFDDSGPNTFYLCLKNPDGSVIWNTGYWDTFPMASEANYAGGSAGGGCSLTPYTGTDCNNRVGPKSITIFPV